MTNDRPNQTLADKWFRASQLEHDFQLARGRAITGYVNVELALCGLLNYLLGTQLDYAASVFFKINNARARRVMLEELLRRKHGNTYNSFAGSLFNKLGTLDDRRNHIVHWAALLQTAGGKETGVKLIHPNYLDYDAGSTDIDQEGLYGFLLQCDFYSNLVNRFRGHLDETEDGGNTWFEIFQKPVTYPPPSTHPLYRSP